MLKQKTCAWKGCTKSYSEHTIAELDNHKSMAYSNPQTWVKAQRFGTIASIFSSFLLIFWIVLGGFK